MHIKALAAAALALPLFASAQTAPKDAWLQHVGKNMPTAFCTQQMYFRQCFTVSVQECEAAAAAATRDCISKHAADIPPTLTMPDDGRRWGGVIGKCAGTATELALIRKRISNARCNDPKQWQ